MKWRALLFVAVLLMVEYCGRGIVRTDAESVASVKAGSSSLAESAKPSSAAIVTGTGSWQAPSMLLAPGVHEHGVYYIVSLARGSSWERAGARSNDVIRRINGKPITSLKLETIGSLFEQHVNPVTLELERKEIGGKPPQMITVVTVPTGERAEAMDHTWSASFKMTGSLPTIKVNFNDQAVGIFALDTDAPTGVADPAMEKMANLKPGPDKPGVPGPGNAPSTVRLVDEVIIPGLPASRRGVSFNTAADFGEPINGILGIDSLEGLQVLIDFAARTTTVYQGKPLDAAAIRRLGFAPEKAVALEPTSEYEYHAGLLASILGVSKPSREDHPSSAPPVGYRVRAQIDGRPVSMELDTGSETTTLNRELTRTMKLKMVRENDAAGSLYGTVKTCEIRPKTIQLGGCTLKSPAIWCYGEGATIESLPQLDKLPKGSRQRVINYLQTSLLGRDILSKFQRVFLDFQNHRMYVKLPG